MANQTICFYTFRHIYIIHILYIYTQHLTARFDAIVIDDISPVLRGIPCPEVNVPNPLVLVIDWQPWPEDPSGYPFGDFHSGTPDHLF